MFLSVPWVLLDICPGVGLLDHVLALFLDLWGTSILFYRVAGPIDILTNSASPLFRIFTSVVSHQSCWPEVFFSCSVFLWLWFQDNFNLVSLEMSTKKKQNCTTWELQNKFYLRQNEDYSLGNSISGSSEKLLQRGSGERSVCMILVKGEYMQSSAFFFFFFFGRRFLLVRKKSHHFKGF